MNKCKANRYTTNNVILHGAIVCWGYLDQPRCRYLRECVEDNKQHLSIRKYNKIIKILKHEHNSCKKENDNT